MSKPDEALILARSILERPHDPDSAMAVLAHGVVRHHSASVVVQSALVQSFSLQAHWSSC
jgi:hypothetical protein